MFWKPVSIISAQGRCSAEGCKLECPHALLSDTNFGPLASLLREMTDWSVAASCAATACMEKYTHESCNTDSCPLETDLSPIKRVTRDPHSLDLNYGQKGERPRLHPLSHLPFSFVRKIDFKKAINLQQFI